MPLVSLRNRLASLGTGDPNVGLHGSETSGPRGIESIIEYNGLYLNVRDWIDTYLVTTILGIDDADVRDARDQNPGRHGETPGNALYGGRTISLQGKIKTRTLWKLRDMEQALRAAFVDLSVERPLIFHGSKIEEDMLCYCKKSQKLDIPDNQTTDNFFERPFNITLRASNPRFFSSMSNYSEWLYPGSSSFDDIIFDTVNLGNFEAQPLLELTGPMTTPILLNEQTNDIIKFNSSIPSGEVWVIDMSGPRVYRKSDRVNRFNYVDGISTDLLVDPEAPNPIHLITSGLTVDSRVSFWTQNTYM